MRFTAYWLAFLIAALAGPAFSFCGLYVARADGELFNDASKVVITRDGGHTAITMSSDYHGEPSEFAMVLPTPVVLEREQVRTVSTQIMSAIDAYSAPRLVEYEDYDPCDGGMVQPMAAEPVAMMSGGAKEVRRRGPAAFGVTVKAEYAVGIYDVVILDATQSDGLVAYLLQEGYNIPDGAVDVLGDYIAGGMKFFVARVNLGRQAKSGAELEPLQITFDTDKFMLPIRLGMVNARGPQDMLVMVLSRKGRVQVMNYPTHQIHTDQEIPIFVRQRFGEFYKAMFSRTVRELGGTGILLEYAWDMAWCDPCAADPLTNDQLAVLGVNWLGTEPNAGQDVFVTRLHARYDASFKEDLVFGETTDRSNFQGRYILREPFKGAFTCSRGEYQPYVDQVRERIKNEARTVAALTGWRLGRINEEIAKTVQARYR